MTACRPPAGAGTARFPRTLGAGAERVGSCCGQTPPRLGARRFPGGGCLRGLAAPVTPRGCGAGVRLRCGARSAPSPSLLLCSGAGRRGLRSGRRGLKIPGSGCGGGGAAALGCGAAGPGGRAGPGWAPLTDMLTFFLVSGGSLWLFAGKSLSGPHRSPTSIFGTLGCLGPTCGCYIPAAAEPQSLAAELPSRSPGSPQFRRAPGGVWKTAGSAEICGLAYGDPTTSFQFSLPSPLMARTC